MHLGDINFLQNENDEVVVNSILEISHQSECKKSGVGVGYPNI